MTINEAINFVENMIYNYRPHGEQLEDWNKLLNLLRWWREQDLIKRASVLVERNCIHEECLKKNRDCNNCFYNVIEVRNVLMIPKAEPPCVNSNEIKQEVREKLNEISGICEDYEPYIPKE